MNKYLEKTYLLDYDNKDIQKLLYERSCEKLDELKRMNKNVRRIISH